MKKHDVMVSVRVLAYNQEKYISSCLDAILAQKVDFDYEILIGEDASTDATRDILLEYQKKHPNTIRLFLRDENLGLLENYRQTTDETKGKYIAGCGGDDLWIDPTKLQKQVDFLEANPDHCLIYTDTIRIDETGKELPQADRKYYEGNVFENLLRESFITASTACIRSESYKKTVDFNKFIEKGFPMEDLPVWLSLAHKGKFKYLKDKTVAYRVNKRSITNDRRMDKQIDYAQKSIKVRKYFMQEYQIAQELFSEVEFYHNRLMYYKHLQCGKRKESRQYLAKMRRSGHAKLKHYAAYILLNKRKKA